MGFKTTQPLRDIGLQSTCRTNRRFRSVGNRKILNLDTCCYIFLGAKVSGSPSPKFPSSFFLPLPFFFQILLSITITQVTISTSCRRNSGNWCNLKLLLQKQESVPTIFEQTLVYSWFLFNLIIFFSVFLSPFCCRLG